MTTANEPATSAKDVGLGAHKCAFTYKYKGPCWVRGCWQIEPEGGQVFYSCPKHLGLLLDRDNAQWVFLVKE